MIWVCQNHVNIGLKMLDIPHIKKVNIEVLCLFCQQKASFEVYYFTLGYSKETSEQLDPNVIAH